MPALLAYAACSLPQCSSSFFLSSLSFLTAVLPLGMCLQVAFYSSCSAYSLPAWPSMAACTFMHTFYSSLLLPFRQFIPLNRQMPVNRPFLLSVRLHLLMGNSPQKHIQHFCVWHAFHPMPACTCYYYCTHCLQMVGFLLLLFYTCSLMCNMHDFEILLACPAASVSPVAASGGLPYMPLMSGRWRPFVPFLFTFHMPFHLQYLLPRAYMRQTFLFPLPILFFSGGDVLHSAIRAHTPSCLLCCWWWRWVDLPYATIQLFQVMIFRYSGIRARFLLQHVGMACLPGGAGGGDSYSPTRMLLPAAPPTHTW